tara:strand:- start:898 stop:1524 length:627 start_codon:yes stop_codon:yes gene_type:complete
MEQELEYKYDIAADQKEADMLEVIEQVLKNESICVQKRTTRDRVFHYYDTAEFACLEKGWTLRRVAGFDPKNGDGKGLFRYDMKVGEVNTAARLEGKYWTDTSLSPAEVVSHFDCADQVAQCSVVASAGTRHHKFVVTFFGTTIEMSYDLFWHEDGELMFQELECELVKGDPAQLDAFCHMLRKASGETFSIIAVQKYQRVMDYIRSL